MTDRAWKAQERVVAAALGTTRNPNTGEHRTDLDTPFVACEHKARRSLPAWLTKALRQARGGATHGRTPVVVLSEVRAGVKAQRYVLMAFEDFVEWHGRLATKEAT